MANTPEIQYEHLLCERCKTVIATAKTAQEAIAKLQALDEVQPAQPAIPGRLLSRGERLEKARALLPEVRAARPEPVVTRAVGDTSPITHQTVNGTPAPRPWLNKPRKQIGKRAEADLEKVIAGTMSRKQWLAKHPFSEGLLVHRLALRGAAQREPGKNPVPGYKSPSELISDADLIRILRGELSGNAYAKQHGMATGTVYRILEKNRKRLREAAGLPGRARAAVLEHDLSNIFHGRIATAVIAGKYGIAANSVTKQVHAWAERNGKKWTPTPGRAVGATDELPDEAPAPTRQLTLEPAADGGGEEDELAVFRELEAAVTPG